MITCLVHMLSEALVYYWRDCRTFPFNSSSSPLLSSAYGLRFILCTLEAVSMKLSVQLQRYNGLEVL